MAVVTGRSFDFAFGPLTSRMPIVRFHPRQASGAVSVRNDWVLPHRAVDATWVSDPEQVGEWEINLVPTMGGTTPDMWFEVEIITLGDQGEFTGSWWWPSKVHVPPEGGAFSELPGGPMSSESVWVSLTPPADSWRGWWLYSPAAGEQMPLDDPRIGDLIQGPGPFIV